MGFSVSPKPQLPLRPASADSCMSLLCLKESQQLSSSSCQQLEKLLRSLKITWGDTQGSTTCKGNSLEVILWVGILNKSGSITWLAHDYRAELSCNNYRVLFDGSTTQSWGLHHPITQNRTCACHSHPFPSSPKLLFFRVTSYMDAFIRPQSSLQSCLV